MNKSSEGKGLFELLPLCTLIGAVNQRLSNAFAFDLISLNEEMTLNGIWCLILLSFKTN